MNRRKCHIDRESRPLHNVFMKKFIIIIFSALLTLTSAAQESSVQTSSTQESSVQESSTQESSAPTRYTVETVPQTEILSWSYVTDLSGVVSPSQKDSLNALCHFAKDSLQSEIAVVVLPAIDNGKYGSLHEFGVELFNKWGIGGKDSEKGLLIVLALAAWIGYALRKAKQGGCSCGSGACTGCSGGKCPHCKH